MPCLMHEMLYVTAMSCQEDQMQGARDLARVKDAVRLVGGEHLLESWVAQGEQAAGSVLGLVLVTDLRLIFVDVEGGLTAFPIPKIDAVEITSPCGLTLIAWYGRLALTFDNADVMASMLNMVRQDGEWNAVETERVGLCRPAAGAANERVVARTPDALRPRVGARRHAATEPLEAV